VEPVLDLKKRLRAAARLARATAFERHGPAAQERLAAHGLAFARISRSAIVSGFNPIGEEISPLPLLLTLLELGHAVCLPVMAGKGEPLVFREWTPGATTREAVWGIREPLPSAAVLEPDVLLVPLLAFDTTGNRLGYGGGFYDRTITRLKGRKPVVTIGVAFDEQRMEEVPHGEHDQRLDWVLTPTGPVRCSESNDLE
jgi:5-formyltetrahydrofolate cyclo-ligase